MQVEMMLCRVTNPRVPYEALKLMVDNYDPSFRTGTIMFNHTSYFSGEGRVAYGIIKSVRMVEDALLGVCEFNQEMEFMINDMRVISKSIEGDYCQFNKEEMEVKNDLIYKKENLLVPIGVPIYSQDGNEILAVGLEKDRDGKFIGPYLTGVAFLGDKQPAVSNMPTLQDEVKYNGVMNIPNIADFFKEVVKLQKEKNIGVQKMSILNPKSWFANNIKGVKLAKLEDISSEVLTKLTDIHPDLPSVLEKMVDDKIDEKMSKNTDDQDEKPEQNEDDDNEGTQAQDDDERSQMSKLEKRFSKALDGFEKRIEKLSQENEDIKEQNKTLLEAQNLGMNSFREAMSDPENNKRWGK